jgi:hypothetical protein
LGPLLLLLLLLLPLKLMVKLLPLLLQQLLLLPQQPAAARMVRASHPQLPPHVRPHSATTASSATAVGKSAESSGRSTLRGRGSPAATAGGGGGGSGGAAIAVGQARGTVTKGTTAPSTKPVPVAEHCARPAFRACRGGEEEVSRKEKR